MQKNLVFICLIFALSLSIIKSYEYDNNPYETYDPEDLENDFPNEATSCPVGKYPGIFWDGQKCDSCYNKACFCKTYQGCDSCTDYYSKDNEGKCSKCEAIYLDGGYSSQRPLTCCFDSKCNYAYSAITCESGAYKYGGVCVKLDNCATYSLYGTCTKCQSGYYLDDDQSCKSCERDYCSECSGPYLCKTCEPGYYLAPRYYTEDNTSDAYRFGTCEQCPQDYCICSTPKAGEDPVCTNCITGIPGLFWDKMTTTCSVCTDNCITCLTNTTCKQCAAYYYLDADSLCSPCTGNCHNCIWKDGKEQCISSTCYNGYYYDDDVEALTCEPCPQENAARCKGPDPIDITQCVTGIDLDAEPYYFDSYWITHQNQYYLVEYTDSTSTKIRECVVNEGNCKQIKAVKNTDTEEFEFICSSCYTELNYVLLKNDNFCYECDDINVGIEGCVKCHSGDAILESLICDGCTTGMDIDDLYYVDQWWDDDEETFDSFSNLRADPLTNYYLDKSGVVTSDSSTAANIICTECPEGCKTCNYDSTKEDILCSACQKGYLLSDDKTTCDQCDDTQCLDCKTGVDQCSICFPGYRKYTDPDDELTKCQPCSEFCLKCDSNQDQCTQCYSGEDNNYEYYLSNGQCLRMRTGCIMGSANGDCVLCSYGFRIVDGWCHKCGMVNEDGSNSLAYVNCYDYCQSKDFINDGGSTTTSNTNTSTNNTDNLNLSSPILTYAQAILLLFSTLLLILV